jgi:predicted MFS family arabinose efflux permease
LALTPAEVNRKGGSELCLARTGSHADFFEYKSFNSIRLANSRLLIPVIASAGAVGLSIGLIIPLTSIVLEQRDISIIAIGLNATVYSLAVLLTGPFLPAIIHRIGLLNSMFAGALLSGVFVIGISLDDSLWLWFLLRFCMGFSGGMHWVGSET